MEVTKRERGRERTKTRRGSQLLAGEQEVLERGKGGLGVYTCTVVTRCYYRLTPKYGVNSSFPLNLLRMIKA